MEENTKLSETEVCRLDSKLTANIIIRNGCIKSGMK